MQGQSPLLHADLREFIWRRTDAVFKQYALNRPPLTKYYKEVNNFLKLLESNAPHDEIRKAYERLEEADHAVNSILTFATYWQGLQDGLLLTKEDPLSLYYAKHEEE